MVERTVCEKVPRSILVKSDQVKSVISHNQNQRVIPTTAPNKYIRLIKADGSRQRFKGPGFQLKVDPVFYFKLLCVWSD